MTRQEIFERKLIIDKDGVVKDVYGNEHKDECGYSVVVEPLTKCLGKCPMCESKDINYKEKGEIQDDSIYYKAECNGCGKIFEEWHDVVYSSTIC